jgi:hypothetical protein
LDLAGFDRRAVAVDDAHGQRDRAAPHDQLADLDDRVRARHGDDARRLGREAAALHGQRVATAANSVHAERAVLLRVRAQLRRGLVERSRDDDQVALRRLMFVADSAHELADRRSESHDGPTEESSAGVRDPHGVPRQESRVRRSQVDRHALRVPQRRDRTLPGRPRRVGPRVFARARDIGDPQHDRGAHDRRPGRVDDQRLDRADRVDLERHDERVDSRENVDGRGPHLQAIEVRTELRRTERELQRAQAPGVETHDGPTGQSGRRRRHREADARRHITPIDARASLQLDPSPRQLGFERPIAAAREQTGEQQRFALAGRFAPGWRGGFGEGWRGRESRRGVRDGRDFGRDADAIPVQHAKQHGDAGGEQDQREREEAHGGVRLRRVKS